MVRIGWIFVSAVKHQAHRVRLKSNVLVSGGLDVEANLALPGELSLVQGLFSFFALVSHVLQKRLSHVNAQSPSQQSIPRSQLQQRPAVCRAEKIQSLGRDRPDQIYSWSSNQPGPVPSALVL